MSKVTKKAVKKAVTKPVKKAIKKAAAPKKPRRLKDSDGDGLSDFDEINIFGSDPYNADSNGDGLEDGEAVLKGRDPVTGGKIKDFFIPHAGNNYSPHALRPKRVIFHAAAALAVKAVVVFFVASYPLLAWMTPDVAAGEGQKIIALTNELRTSLSLRPLKENTKLDMAAAKKVEDMFINQYFAHVSPRGLDLEHFLALAGYKDYATVGENLAMGYSSAAEAMAAWKKSPTHYANLTDENYSQIGVGLAGGSYSDVDTVFIAQYFGLPNSFVAVAPKLAAAKTTAETSASTGEKAVLSEKTNATDTTPKKVAQAPLLTREQAKVTIDTPAGKPTEKVIKVEAVLPAETKSAVAQVEDTNVVLSPVPTSATIAFSQVANPSENLWAGQIAVTSDKKEDASIVPPAIIATDNAGNTAQVMVSPESIKPARTSLLDQYFLFKTSPNNGLGKIFDAGSLYFNILLALVIAVLTVNILVNIKKQRYKPILSGVGLIALLVILILF